MGAHISWGSIEGFTGSDGMSNDGKQKRRGSKRRQNTKRRTGALRRDALPNAPLPRHRQPTINDKNGACYLTAAEFADALEHHHAELLKSRLNLDYIVHLLKAGTDSASIRNIIETAVEECRMTFAKGKETLDDFKELLTTAEDAPGPKR
jgi:hypothetical protein